MWKIYSSDGTKVRYEIATLEYNGTWMGECYITATITTPKPITWEIGDYTEYRGERFELNYIPTLVKSQSGVKSGEEFKYDTVKFNSLSDELTRCDFNDYVLEDNELHYTSLPKFSFYAQTIQALADRIQANLDRIYTGDKKWTVICNPELVERTDRNISVDSINVWEALALVNSEFKANFIIRGRTITIGTSGIIMNDVLKIGKNKGLYEIKRQADETQAIITRLRAYGSTRNMPTRYYNKKYPNTIPNNMAVSNLMLPGFPDTTSDPYIDSDNKKFLGIREASVFFDGSDEDLDEIYPCLNEAKVVSAEQATDDGTWDDLNDGDNIPNFKITIEDIGFDINDYLSNEAATISFKTGKCAGREFEIVSCTYDATNKHYILNCARAEDTDIDLYFPNKYYNIQSGDEYVLLNIEMPDIYIEDAAQRLLTAAKKYLAENDYVRYTYTPSIDEIRLKRQDDEAQVSNGKIDSIYQTIKEGDIMAFDDEDIGSVTIAIDTLKITEEDEKLPKVTVTLTDEKTVGTIEKIQNKIDAIVSGGTGSGATTSQLRSYIEKYGKKNFLSRVDDDTASGLIKFLRGIEFANSSGIDSTGNATLGDVKAEDIYSEKIRGVVIEILKQLQSEGFIDSIISGVGKGFGIDTAGRGQFESLEVRGAMRVMELIINRLSAIESEFNFTDTGTIEKVTLLEDKTYLLNIRKRWDYDFTSFAENDVVYGSINTLLADGSIKTSWFRVLAVDTSANTLTVVTYPNSEVPGGVNYAPVAGMNIARRGNALNEDRQSCWYISSFEGVIMYM
jgi:hypothetical protein